MVGYCEKLQMTSAVLPWRSRLAVMDHAGGTSNKMIQEAMRAEIAEWRKLSSPLNTDLAKAYKTTADLQDQVSAMRSLLRAERARCKGRERAVETVRKERDEWRQQAQKYRKQIIESKP